ncbi:hypothetical protein ACFV4N_40605, partial [Actinosynnema sp. NPDC059797]
MAAPVVGVVVPATGRLARLGPPLEFAARAFPWPFEVLTRDSGSTAEGARAAVRSLVGAGARLVVALGGTEALPAVVGACAEHEVPSVTTTLPWQLVAGLRSDRSFHFCWG